MKDIISYALQQKRIDFIERRKCMIMDLSMKIVQVWIYNDPEIGSIPICVTNNEDEVIDIMGEHREGVLGNTYSLEAAIEYSKRWDSFAVPYYIEDTNSMIKRLLDNKSESEKVLFNPREVNKIND